MSNITLEFEDPSLEEKLGSSANIYISDLSQELQSETIEGSDEPVHLTIFLGKDCARIGFEIKPYIEDADMEQLEAVKSFSNNIYDILDKKVFGEYINIVDAYFRVIKSGIESAVEAIDMNRRGIHNELANDRY